MVSHFTFLELCLQKLAEYPEHSRKFGLFIKFVLRVLLPGARQVIRIDNSLSNEQGFFLLFLIIYSLLLFRLYRLGSS